jgi:hypothetical protein
MATTSATVKKANATSSKRFKKDTAREQTSQQQQKQQQQQEQPELTQSLQKFSFFIRLKELGLTTRHLQRFA